MKQISNMLVVAFVALFANGFAMAQEAQGKEDCCADTFKIGLHEDVTIFNFDGGLITQWDTTIAFKLDADIHASVNLPVYNDNVSDSQTGIGDVQVDLTYKKAFSFDKIWVDLVGGFAVPLDGEYSSSDCTFSGGAVLGFSWDEFDFSQSAKYTLVNDFTYMPIFGGFVEDNVFQATSSLKYKVSDKFKVGAEASQYYTDGQNAIVVGPNMSYNINENIAFNAGVGFAVTDDLDFEDMDTVMNFGIGFKF
jgi:hypothetical protein